MLGSRDITQEKVQQWLFDGCKNVCFGNIADAALFLDSWSFLKLISLSKFKIQIIDTLNLDLDKPNTYANHHTWTM